MHLTDLTPAMSDRLLAEHAATTAAAQPLSIRHAANLLTDLIGPGWTSTERADLLAALSGDFAGGLTYSHRTDTDERITFTPNRVGDATRVTPATAVTITVGAW